MWAIFKREFRAFFQSVIGWLFLAVTLGIFGLYFYVYNLLYGYPYLANTLSAITFVLMITVPVLTMRILAEERKSKTDQLILTAPVSVGKVVIGKFLSMAAIFSIAVVVMCITPLVLSFFGSVPYGECYSALLGYWLFGLTCIAIGTFVSSLTESQVIAAVVTFLALFLGYMMSGITSVISSTGNILTSILSCYDLVSGMDDFLSGFLNVQAVIYYLSMTALFLFLTVQVIQKRRWSISSKKLKTGVFSTSFIAVALAATVVVNLIGSQLPESIRAIDVTSQKLYSITDETKELLDNLSEDITIYVLANEDTQDTNVGKTLERYANYSKYIHVEYKDPAVSPSFYTNYTSSSVSQNSLIVEGSKRSKVINYNDLYETEIDYTTYTSTATGYDAEGQLSSAITYVTNEDNPVIYQISGHDEQTLSGSFTDAISKLNVTLETLNLLEADAIPEDAQGLILNAPAKDLSQDDVTKILDYLKQGGKALIVSGYTGEEMPNFESLLAEYQVTVAPGIVMEGSSNNYYQYPYYILTQAGYDAATADVSGDYIFVPYAQGLLYPQETTEETEDTEETTDSGITYTELLSTSDSAYAKANVTTMETYEKEEGDVDGPFALGLHISQTLDEEEGTSTELYVFSGDSIFTEQISQMVYGNNATMFTGVVSQFVDSEVTSVIPVKSYDYAQLTIPQTGIVLAGLAMAIVIPVILLLAGIIIWVRRRRK